MALLDGAADKGLPAAEAKLALIKGGIQQLHADFHCADGGWLSALLRHHHVHRLLQELKGLLLGELLLDLVFCTPALVVILLVVGVVVLGDNLTVVQVLVRHLQQILGGIALYVADDEGFLAVLAEGKQQGAEISVASDEDVAAHVGILEDKLHAVGHHGHVGAVLAGGGNVDELKAVGRQLGGNVPDVALVPVAKGHGIGDASCLGNLVDD